MDYSAGTFQVATEVLPDTRYAAVSYRWGSGKDAYTFTRKTKEVMKSGVSMGVLPKTIFDTFTIAHHLNFKYIWVDRLCILQDSREDWSREASRMAFIYKHAFLTISASCASHDNQGCFRRRHPAGMQPLQLSSNPLLPRHGFSGNLSYITSYPPKEDQKLGGKLGHLADRGWVFQERILSHRIVHFAEEEIYWECGELEASESWPDWSPNAIPLRPSLLYGPGTKRRFKHSSWHVIVQHYSARVFTYDGDRLPALSGLAKETLELRKDANEGYLAGLWRSTVLFDLCWYRDCGTLRLRIPEDYLAPSWSWASLHGKVCYDRNLWGVEYGPAAKFEDSRLKLAASNSYGAVHDGWIHLIGHLKPVVVVQWNLPELVRTRKPWNMELHGIDGKRLPFLDVYFGTLDIETLTKRESVPMFCLPVLKKTNYCPDFYCLILVPNGFIKHRRSGEALPSPKIRQAEQYQRAGLAQLKGRSWVGFQEWLNESPPRDILIR